MLCYFKNDALLTLTYSLKICAVIFLHYKLHGSQNNMFVSMFKQNAAYLIIRGMKTLHLRVQQQNSTALRMAKVLEAHPRV